MCDVKTTVGTSIPRTVPSTYGMHYLQLGTEKADCDGEQST